jgi:hypothetical protein
MPQAFSHLARGLLVPAVDTDTGEWGSTPEKGTDMEHGKKIAASALAVGLLLAAGTVAADRSNTSSSSARIDTQVCGAAEWPLVTENEIEVGSVSVGNSSLYLYVTYRLDFPGATLGDLRAWVGDNLDNLPTDARGTPLPARFCDVDGGACADAAGRTSFTLRLAFDDLDLLGEGSACGAAVYVVARAEVLVDAGAGRIRETRSAFAGPILGPGPRPWQLAEHELCCDLGAPRETECDSAFAKGDFVWAKDAKSNPERLPTLGLSRNAPGWAIRLDAVGRHEYELWAGAERNDTRRGRLVGDVEIFWTGNTVLVTYSLVAGLTLEQLRLYAGDAPPADVTPGRYPQVQEFDPNVDEYSIALPARDVDGDGAVWLVVQASICD